jgi:hypothetical protein
MKKNKKTPAVQNIACREWLVDAPAPVQINQAGAPQLAAQVTGAENIVPLQFRPQTLIRKTPGLQIYLYINQPTLNLI